MNEKTNKIMSSEELDDVLPKYEPIKLSGKNLAQNYVSAFNTGMNIYQCVNYLQGNIDWTIKAVNDVVKSWNTEVSESIDQSKAIVRETTTEQFNTEWTNKQPELIEQVNTLTTNQFNEDWGVLENRINTTLENQNTNIQNIQNEQNELETNTNNNINAQNTKINSIQTQQTNLASQQTNLASQQTNLASQQTNLASQQTTLSNRMDTFTSLSEGSTTGDAELKDIRVGANGITYNNAGDAVRGQYSQLKEDLDDIKGIKLYNIISKVNKTENMYIDGGSGALITNNEFDVSDFIEIQPYCTYYGSTPNLTYHFGAVYDGTKTLIGTIFNLSKINKDTSTFEFIAPKNAKYIRFSLSKSDSSNYVCYEKNRIFTNFGVSDEMLKNGLINLCKIDSNPSNGYIDNEGKYVYSDPSYKVVATDFIEIQPNTIYYGYNENSEHIPEPNYQGAIFDENKELISSIYNIVGAKSNYSFKAPSNAKYVRLTIFYNSNQYFYKKHNLDSFETSEFNKPEEKINIMYKTQIRKPLVFNGKTCVFCGDSITAGSTSSSTETENNFPKLFCQAVNSTMVNLAVGGSTLSKVDGYGCIFDQIKNNENKNCDFLFVCGGINDWQLGVQLDVFKQTMKNICDYINANYSNSTKVIFITPINECGWDPIKTPVATIQNYRNIISMSIIENDTYSRFSLIQGTDFNFPTKDDNAEFIDIAYGDKLHPSELGYKNIYTVGLLNTLI